MARVLIGTSGWHYDSWRGPFFPKGLPLKEQLPYYSSQFSTTELNGVFYRTPTPEAVASWRKQTQRNFIFAWKASNSSPIGSGSRTIRSTASNCWKIACPCSAPKPARSCFNYRRTSRLMPTGLSPSSSCCPGNSPRTLSEWARRIRSWKRQGCDVFVYFDNDQKSAAPADARSLRRLMGQA
jgi:uncharacterized protein YecE (DUF72 family)